jgi:D-threo-aldose 1-dehydrogenase
MVKLTDRRKLGKSDITLPPLGIGCAPIGEIYDHISDAETADMLEAALNAGVRYFDVAPSYGVGLAEMRLGRALRRAANEHDTAVPVARSDIFVSTKLSRRLVPDRTVGPNTGDNSSGHNWVGGLEGFRSEFDCSYSGFMQQHNESLQRMGQPYVNGVLVHGPGGMTDPAGKAAGTVEGDRWDQLTNGGGFRALEELRSSGAVQAIGVGEGPPCSADTLAAILKACPSMDYMCLAGSFSLLEQPVHTDGILSMLQDAGCGAVIFAPFNSGILAGGSAALKARAKFNYFDAAPELVERVVALESTCAKHGVPLITAALQFPLMHPAVASVVCGVRSAAEAEANCEMIEAAVPSDLWRSLKEAGLLPSSLVRQRSSFLLVYSGVFPLPSIYEYITLGGCGTATCGPG